VDGRVVDVAGVRVAGLGGSHRYEPGPNQYTDRQQSRRVRRLIAQIHRRQPPRPMDIVLAHAPIAGMGDGGEDDRAHQGFRAFQRLVTILEPRLFLHGHINGAAGRTERHIGTTRVVNVFDHQLIELAGAAPHAAEGD
jgi:Icc-related predicted phosphoesterase